MAVDNPSYFSLSGGASSSATATTATTTTTLASPTSPRGFSALFHRRACKMGAAATSQGGILISESMSSVQMHREGRASGTSTPSTPTEERVAMLSRNGAIHPGCSKRRSFRNLFRSVSANADHEKTQNILKGDPRPSDIASPLPYKPHRSRSHSEKDECHHNRPRRVLKSASELLSNDMVYCGLTGNSSKNHNGNDGNGNNDDDTVEVFFGVEDARYYNVPATLPTTASERRHSIGTFFGKETGACNIVASGRQMGGSRKLLEADTVASPVPIDDTDGVHCNESKQPSCNRTRRKRHKISSNKDERVRRSDEVHSGSSQPLVFGE